MNVLEISQEEFDEVCKNDKQLTESKHRTDIIQETLDYFRDFKLTIIEDAIRFGKTHFNTNDGLLVVDMIIKFQQKPWTVIMVNNTRASIERIGTEEQDSISNHASVQVLFDPRKEIQNADINDGEKPTE